MNKLTKYLPPALATLAFTIAYLYLYFSAVPLFADTDVPWHLAAGNLILHLGRLPQTDPWSFASGGQPWYIISWLWDVIIELVRRAGDLRGVFAFTVALMAFNVGLLAYALLKRGDAGGDAIILTLFLAMLSFKDFTEARPQLIGYACILWTHWSLHKSRADARLRPLLFLPLLMILWVNTHGSFMAGFTLFGAYGLEALICKRWQWFKHLVLVGALCALALLVNPYGFHMYDAVMRSLHSVVTQFILEWMPFVFSNDIGMSAWMLVFILAGCVREARVPIADKIVCVLWLVATLLSVRNAAIFVLVSAPALAASLHAVTLQLASIRTVRPDMLAALQPMRLRMAAAAAVVVIGSVLMMDVLKGKTAVTPDADPAPVIAYLKEHAQGKRVLNEFNYGGRIIYGTGGAVPIFVDGRAGTAYPEEVLSEYLDFMGQKEGWKRILGKYRIDMIMVDNRHMFALTYARGQNQEWQRVYHDEVASIFVRK